MPGDGEKGAFSADIPTDAIEEALRSVEKTAGGGAEAEVQAEGAPEGEAPEEAAAERERLAAQLELSMQKGRETLEKLKEEHDRFLRAAADLETACPRWGPSRAAAMALGNMGAHALPAISALAKALADPDGSVRQYAAKALGAIGPPAAPALPALEELARTDALRATAEEAMDRIRGAK